MVEVEIVELGESVQVRDQRGHLLTTCATRREAEQWRAGYRAGWQDAGAVVAPSAERLTSIGRGA